MSENIHEALAGMVSYISGCEKELKDSACLYHDLRIAGDDAGELLEGVQKKFGTNFDKFEFTEYFPNETEITSYRISKLFGFKDKFKRFTFGHLVKVVEAGHWFEEHDSIAKTDK